MLEAAEDIAAVAAVIAVLFGANLIAQRLLPTFVRDPAGRRYAYRLVTMAVIACALAVAYLVAVRMNR